MDRIGNYGVYQRNYYDSPQAAKTSAASAAETGAAKDAGQKKVELSDAAANLLKEMKQEYGNADFIIADYESDEEAATLLARGRAAYSVLLTPEELEKMAADKSVEKENRKALDDAFAQLADLKDQLGEKGEQVTRMGVAIGDGGEVSYFAELEKVSEKQRERIEEKRVETREKNRETRAEKTRERWEELQGRGPEGMAERERGKRTTVYASSVEELMERIGQVNWDEVPAEVTPSGHRFDFTV